MNEPLTRCNIYHRGNPRHAWSMLNCLLFTISLATFAAVCSAQDEIPEDAAPPPLKFISKEEVRLLDGERDVKKRTRLALQLMETRLKSAEAVAEREQFDEMFDELGVFHGLMDNTLDFLSGSGKASKKLSGKVLNNFKRFEIGLRGFTPRLELLRRNVPSTHEFYVRSLLKQLREARTRATEPLYGDSVLSIKKS